MAQRTGKSGPEVVVRVGKTHQDYWRARLLKRTYAWKGQECELPDWHVRIAHLGRRDWFNLGTPNKAAAGAKARDIYLSLVAAGWETTLAKYKPDMVVASDGCTVGDFLEQVKAVSGLKPGTFEIYARKFRSLCADVFSVTAGAEKHDYVNGGHKAWLAKVHAIRLDKLTPEKVNDWKVRKLTAASSNPLRLKHAQVTVRSILLSSKALFAPEIRKHLTLRLPSPLPFQDVELPPVGKSRYKAEINPAMLLQQAQRELLEAPEETAVSKTRKRGGQPQRVDQAARREMFKILLLALGAGLRRDEIDTLQWRQIQWHRNVITVETTEHTGAKSAESEADVDVDPGLLEILRAQMPEVGKGSPFVIQSKVHPRPAAATYHHYRCDRLFKALVAWLREKGISARNALHALRKEFGSQICAQAGIYAASAALRHSSINLTREYYVDKKQVARFEISKLLGTSQTEAAGQSTLNVAA